MTSAAAARVNDNVTELPDVVMSPLFVTVEKVHRTQAGGDTARRRRWWM